MISTIFQSTDPTINPQSPLDWTLIAVVAMSVVASVGAGAKRIIDWVVSKVTAPDTRIEELEKEKTQREQEDRARFVKLEAEVERLRADLVSVHKELQLSEIARAQLEGELRAIRALLDKHAIILDPKTIDQLKETND